MWTLENNEKVVNRDPPELQEALLYYSNAHFCKNPNYPLKVTKKSSFGVPFGNFGRKIVSQMRFFRSRIFNGKQVMASINGRNRRGCPIKQP